MAGKKTARTCYSTFTTPDPAGNVSAARVLTVKAPKAKAAAKKKAKRRPAFAGSVGG